MGAEKSEMKKGTWSPEEDQKLLAYVKKHGPGKWTSVANKSGLLRTGKSCRLRWRNYLRPDIKRGKLTLQEETLVIQLHGLLGNRWAAIAAFLDKRTDNEIKNYWNTHLKKRLLKSGIDPYTHKPEAKNSCMNIHEAGVDDVSMVDHKSQWEMVKLEAEARLARESAYQNLQTGFSANEEGGGISTDIFPEDFKKPSELLFASPHSENTCEEISNSLFQSLIDDTNSSPFTESPISTLTMDDYNLDNCFMQYHQQSGIADMPSFSQTTSLFARELHP